MFMLLLWEETQLTLIPGPSEWKAAALQRVVIKWGPHTSVQGAVQSANTANAVLAETSTHGFSLPMGRCSHRPTVGKLVPLNPEP